MQHDELVVLIARLLNGAPEMVCAYPWEDHADPRGMSVEVVTGPDERWSLYLEKAG